MDKQISESLEIKLHLLIKLNYGVTKLNVLTKLHVHTHTHEYSTVL